MEDYADDVVAVSGRGPNPWITAGSILISLTLVLIFIILTGHSSSKPVIGVADEAAIRTAQVRVFRAQAAIQNLVPEMNAANAALNDAVNKTLAHAGVDPVKFTVDEKDGALMIVPKPAPTTPAK